MTTFNDWFSTAFDEDQIRDIATHGADSGFPGIVYTSETVEIYDRFEDEIYEALNEDAQSLGYNSPDALIATFRRSDMLAWPDGRKNLLVWYMVERRAHQLIE